MAQCTFKKNSGQIIDYVLLNCRLNRKGKFNLEKDLKDKFSALSIDEDCRELRNNSAGLRFKGDAAKIETK